MKRFVSGLALAALVGCANGVTNGPNGEPSADRNLKGVVERGDVRYTAEVAVMESFPVQLAGDVTITNTSDEPVGLTFPDGCVALLRAYEHGGEEPVWDQAGEVACTMALVEVELASGESHEVRTPTASAAEILDEGLPDGEYTIAVYLRPQRGAVEIEAGIVELAIPR